MDLLWCQNFAAVTFFMVSGWLWFNSFGDLFFKEIHSVLVRAIFQFSWKNKFENMAHAFLCRDSVSLDAIFLVLSNLLTLREEAFKDEGISSSISDTDSDGDFRPDDGSMPISTSLNGNLRSLQNNDDDKIIIIMTNWGKVVHKIQ